MRSVPRMTWQLTFSRVQPARPNGLSGLNFGCLRHDCFQKMYNLRAEPDPILDPASILKKPWDGTSLLSTPSTDLYKAHVALHTDVKQRMIDNLKQSTRIKFIISTMLDPRFKNFNFKGHQMFCECKGRAERYLRDEHSTNWAPILATPG